MAATARRTAERSLQSKPTIDQPVVAKSHRMDIVFLSAGCVAILLIGAYVARQIFNPRQLDALPVAGQAVPASADTRATSVSVVPPALAPKTVGEMPTPAVTPAMPAAESSPVPAKSEAAKRPNSRLRSAPVEATTAPDLAPPPPVIAVAPDPVPVSPVREPPKPDALQLMKEGLAQCTGNIIDRILCDQRVRREYCNGRWGQVPECSSSVPNDRGQ